MNTYTLKDFGYKYIALELDNRCNMVCTFCPQPLRRRADDRLGIDTVEKIYDESAAVLHPEEIHLNILNEPLLDPDIWEYIAMARSYGLRCSMATNGLLLTKKNVLKLMDIPPREVRISLQVIRRENYVKARPQTLEYTAYLDRLAHALAMFCDMQHEIAQIQVDIAVEMQFSDRRRKLLKLCGSIDPGDPAIKGQTPASIEAPLSDFLRAVEKNSKTFSFDPTTLRVNLRNAFTVGSQEYAIAYELSEKLSINLKKFFTGRRQSQFYPVIYGSCKSPYLGIRANGEVGPCCWDCNGEITLGNVKTQSLVDILLDSREKLKRLRKLGILDFDLCRRCVGSPTYHGAMLKSIILGRKVRRHHRLC